MDLKCDLIRLDSFRIDLICVNCNSTLFEMPKLHYTSDFCHRIE